MPLTLSVIIPLHPNETEYWQLLESLSPLPKDTTEIIFTVSKQHAEMVPTDDEHQIQAEFLASKAASISGHQVRWWVSENAGRAVQMNEAALIASGCYLWFVHADSRIGPANISSIEKYTKEIEKETENSLYYFDLKFYSGPKMMLMNAVCVWLRCRLWGLPFGDQALLLPRKLFHSLGGYDIKAAYGEDHLLVWKAKKQRVPVVPIGCFIATSARKYQEYGWLRTTFRHLILFVRQAFFRI